ncbi:ribulokinase [Sediminicola luteus]|uniref:Ribulokinase n=1 Tax=Sediminicola luteus TaxID=319238 RepID=A0A2A4G9R7_9FLAO|nr:ribulokinase [Sediminicola luteus]PCE64726.1 ribulokinase [Sediminicola luteus]
MNNYSLGIDFGSTAVRALLYNITEGSILGTTSSPYNMGTDGVIQDPDQPLLARQCPMEYLHAMERAVTSLSEKHDLKYVVGIGVDATGSTPIPVDAELRPLANQARFANNLNAHAWMWKDHTAHKAANQITELSRKARPDYLKTVGGAYSSEWFWAKILHCAQTDPEVYEAAATWIEFSDYIPAVLCGISHHDQLKRNSCAAGHKALYHTHWGGFPDAEFLDKLHPGLSQILHSLPKTTQDISETSGNLCAEWADKLGLAAGIPVAMGMLDAHSGGLGAGIKPGTLVKILGTSSCDLALGNNQNMGLTGVASVAENSIVPGHLGIEAGQSAVGDLLAWYVDTLLEKRWTHAELTERANLLKPGETGLMALDWNNGNRSILANPMLSGLVVGQDLSTQNHDIYRALIEASAFGARKIIDTMEIQGISIEEVVCCGGITHKNPLFMQIYADVIGKPLVVSTEAETVALGAAWAGAYVGMHGEIGFEALQKSVSEAEPIVYQPQSDSRIIYNQLYSVYNQLHDVFGGVTDPDKLDHIMKTLRTFKNEAKTKQKP